MLIAMHPEHRQFDRFAWQSWFNVGGTDTIVVPDLNITMYSTVSYIELYFRQTQQYTNELSHTTYILEYVLEYAWRWLNEPKHVAKLNKFTNKLKYVRWMREFIGVLLCLTEIKLNIW
jgi:hypothetical protein